MIEIKSVNKYFNKNRRNEIHVLNNISLELENTGLVALLGPSGSGKTTLLNAIGGLDNVKKGKIYVNERKITSKNSGKVDKIRNINIGYIFQDYKLVEDKTVFENIELVLKMIGIKDKKEIKNRVEFILEKVGMYRYKNRLAGALSGGEKQRVAIARAIVKSPNVILADEPTGNLDSKNTLEVMNLIKAISKEKLVILVTHERNLAQFYSDRIIEIKDGSVVEDYKNNHIGELDYQIENNIYLKDFEYLESIKKETFDINFYSDSSDKIKINLVFKNGKIYIQEDGNRFNKIEVLDENSNIKLINDSYKKINKNDVEKLNFDFMGLLNKNIKKRNLSVFPMYKTVINGCKKIFKFSKLKRLMLIGFFISAIFTVYSVSTIRASLKIDDSKFVIYNNNYAYVSQKDVKVEKILQYEKMDNIEYILPGNSRVEINIECGKIMQSSKQYGRYDLIKASVSSTSLINDLDLICGNNVKNKNEVIIDKIILEDLLKDGLYESNYSKSNGIRNIEEFIGREMQFIKVQNDCINKLKIVGIVDKQTPSIYVEDNMMINVISMSQSLNNEEIFNFEMSQEAQEISNQIYSYELFDNSITLKKGKLPVNDYEIIVNISKKDEMPLNKVINTKVNDKKLKVVGYYEAKENIDFYLSNTNTVKYSLITQEEGFTICTKDKQTVINEFENLNLNIEDCYESSREKYIQKRSKSIKSNLITSGIMLLISLVEVYFIIRSSFLSRIKEIGILRAIGVKKKDIFNIFMGEVIAITTLISVLGVIVSTYVITTISKLSVFESTFVMDSLTVGISLAIIYAFNIIVGILPVYKVLRKTPAQILSRHDI